MSVHGSQYLDITCVNASGDLTSHRYRIIKTTGVDTSYSAGNLTAKLCLSATGGVSGPRGVLQNEPDTGQAAIVRIFGITKVVAGEAIAVSDLITAGTCGHAMICDSTGMAALGWAMQAATSATEVITAMITGPFHFPGSSA